MAEIKFCQENFDQGAEDVIKRLEAYGIGYEVEPCLGLCGDCATGPFALVDDELVSGESADDLHDKIKSLLINEYDKNDK